MVEVKKARGVMGWKKEMTYHILNIYDMLRTMDESDIQKMLSSFSCPLNSEVEIIRKSRTIVMVVRPLIK